MLAEKEESSDEDLPTTGTTTTATEKTKMTTGPYLRRYFRMTLKLEEEEEELHVSEELHEEEDEERRETEEEEELEKDSSNVGPKGDDSTPAVPEEVEGLIKVIKKRASLRKMSMLIVTLIVSISLKIGLAVTY